MNLKGKKVCVTGADGFIGSHLTELLLKHGCQVKAFVYYNSFNRWGWLENMSAKEVSQIEVFAGDVRDPNGIRTALQGIDIVFHLAALIGIPYSYHSPDNYVDTNIKGTLNVLQAARDLKLERVLITSTSEVYGTALQVPIEETHPRQGQSPYSATKIGADAMAESFFRSFELPVTIVRPFNTYGPRQSARAVIPTIITQLLSGYTEVKLGSLHPTRDLVYVKDTAQGFLSIAESEQTLGQEVNIATQQEISIGDLANRLVQLINPAARVVLDENRIRPTGSEVERLLGSAEKIRSLTSWQPSYSLEQGLPETIDWFRNPENLSHYKPGIYNI